MSIKKITIPLDLENRVYLTYAQLLDKYPYMEQFFDNENRLFWLSERFVIDMLQRHPREVTEGKAYVFQEADMDLPIAEYIHFYEEKSVLAFVMFSQQRMKAIHALVAAGLKKSDQKRG